MVGVTSRVALRTEYQGVPHPRGGFTFRDLPAETQSAAHSAMEEMHGQAPDFANQLSSQIDELHAKMGRKGGASPARQTQMDVLQQTHQHLQNMPRGMEASVQRVTETAMAPVHAVRQLGKETGELHPVLAGEFYPERHRIGQAISESAFGHDPDAAQRLRLAMPEFSARSTPEMEVQGGAGMAAMMLHGEHVGVHVTQRAAGMFNSLKGGSGGIKPMKGGSYSLAELSEHHPQATALLLQHHAKRMGLVGSGTGDETKNYTPERLAVTQQRRAILDKGTRLDLPTQLEKPMGAMVSGYGDVGFPKGGRAIARFHSDPGEFGDTQFHKIPTYTWNIHNMDPAIAAGTHHFLGVLAHGKKWLDANPEAHAALSAVKNHPAWHDPSSTMDVWSGRVASGLPLHATKLLGDEATNPDKMLKNRGMPNRQGGARYGSPSDVGYLWGEEAHRQAASSMSVHVPGIGRIQAPPHVVQSLSWYGVQAEKNAHQVRMGNRTLAPTSFTDTRTLNSLQFPTIFT